MWPEPPGLWPAEGGARAAIPAPGAEEVLVCLFDAMGQEVARHPLPDRLGDVHHGFVPGLLPGMRYGLRASGPWAARFNPRKLLLDPWARRLDRVARLHPALFDTGDAPDAADSAPHAPKAVLEAPLPPLAPRPRVTGPQVIYEMHVKGFTARHPAIPEAIRGTFAALAHPAAIAHLRALGVTMVELMPAAAWVEERHLPPLGLTNHWGYNPIAFLAPDPRLAPGGMAEVRAAVAALQAAGIAVVQDVVLNHSGEGDELGPTLSLRGLGEAAWYRMRGPGRAFANDAGCGNTLALDRAWPLRLAMDALRHWAGQAGLDGFRLDLATTLGRREHGFDPEAPLILAMRQDPVLRDLLIIAEPWDIGPGGHQLGRFPPGWGEWNDRFRDTTRRFWRGDAGMLGEMATRLAGSADLLGPGRPVADSVNFVTAHDGFTLADLVAYTAKRNHANGEDNRDGTETNHGWNCGVEGPATDPAVLARRAGDMRALLATLLLSRGTPMLSMGDEAGRSQGGNNNAYAQDNATSWFDWDGADAGLRDFTARLVRARLAHPALHGAAALTGGPADAPMEGDSLPDVAWMTPDGGQPDWHDPEARALAAVLTTPEDRCLVALNAGAATALTPPAPRPGRHWVLLADSAEPGRQGRIAGTIPLPARSVVLLAEERPAMLGTTPDTALLDRLSRAAGIAPVWHAIGGEETRVPEATLRALLGAMGLPAETAAQARDSLARLSAPRALPPSLTLRAGQEMLVGAGALDLTLRLADGREVPVTAPRRPERGIAPDGTPRTLHRVALPEGLPIGRHRLVAGREECPLAIVPGQCFLPPGMAAGARRFGVAAQTYALRHARDQGIGDFTALAQLARGAAEAGAGFLGLSPPHALIPTDRERASPYNPSDRRFLDPVLVDVAALEGMPGARAALAEAEPVFAALRRGALVAYPEVWAAKRRVLAAIWRDFPRDDPGLAAFRREMGGALDHFAAFTAFAEHIGHSDTRQWPAAMRHGAAPGVAAFLRDHAEAVGFVAFQQYLADRQLAAAAQAGAGLYRDLAVGAAPDGAEVWSGEMACLRGFSVGAPPDPFAPQGQVWSLPPPDPRALAETGHAGWAGLVRANMRHAAALRIDHVLGLRRLFLVPDGAPGSEGAYVTMPMQDLLGQLALESRAARCLVIGEDLGTVPEGMGEALQGAGVLSYRVLWFERDGTGFRPPEAYPPRAAACVSTHDLATLEGWWRGEDLAERAALGLLEDRDGAMAERAADRAALLAALETEGLLPDGAAAGDPMTDALAAAIHALVARTPCLLALVQAEDLAGERIAVNLPGTDRERPNWRRRITPDVPALLAAPRARAILAAMADRAAA